MKTFVHSWQYVDEFFLEWEMFQTNVALKIETHILSLKLFSPKIVPLWDNVEKYGRNRQATYDNITRRLRIAFWITKVTYPHSEYVIIIAFPRQQWLPRTRLNVAFTRAVPLLLYML
jgi:hypothetical protein